MKQKRDSFFHAEELLIKPILNVIARSLRSRNPLNNDIVKA